VSVSSSAIGQVAAREIKVRLTSKSFRVATMILVAAIVAIIVIPAQNGKKKHSYRVAISGPASDVLKSEIVSLGKGVGASVRLSTPASRPSAEDALRRRKLDILLVTTGQAEIVVRKEISSGSTARLARMVGAVSQAVSLQTGLERAGLAPTVAAQALASPPLPVRGLVQERVKDADRVIAIYGVIMLWILLSQYGGWVLIGVVEEKTSRVVEVLLSTIRPTQLLTGKVLGIGLVALLQAAILIVTAFVTSSAVGQPLLHGPSVVAIFSMLLWFVLGYSFYCTAYAAVGSLVSRQEDAQNAAFPVSLPLLIGYGFSFSAVGGSEPSAMVRFLSYFPPTSPLVMPVLIAVRAATFTQAAIAVALMLVSIFFLMRVAATIYSRAILHTGRRLKIAEVLRSPS
jgi:ABC-2 type transport system permease protein